MKKLLCITAGLLFCAASTQTAFAASGDVTQAGGPGQDVVIDVVNVAGARDVTFTPSTNVNMSGQSSATAFALGSWHEQAVAKTNGQGYGMASDSNKMYFKDISVTGQTVGDITDTNGVDVFTTANKWNTL